MGRDDNKWQGPTHFDDYKHRHSEVTFSGDHKFDIESGEVSKKGLNYYHTKTLLGVRTLPLFWRIIFILTNVPYWFVGLEAAYHVATHENQTTIDTRGDDLVISFAIIDLISVNHLKRCDVSGAFIFGAYLFLCAETRKVVGIFIIPLGLLVASISCKKMKMFRSYAAFHGAWHILGAWALFVVNGLGGRASISNQMILWMFR
eukprot:jgi/Bigna1/87236/estExt_fgenesh1_pg.C_180045